MRSRKVLDGAALAAAYSADGKLLAVAGDGGRVPLLDGRTLGPMRELRTGRGFVQGLAISPDGARIAAATIDYAARGTPGRLQIWALRTGKPIGRPIKIAAVDLAFSPDSRLLAAAAIEGDSAVFAAGDGHRVATLRTGDFGRSVAFSPTARLLALGEYGGTTRMLSTASFKPVGRDLEGHRARITALEFSPDGRRLLTGGADGTLRLWDARTRQPIGSALEVEPDAYVAAAFSSGGTHVVAVPHFGRGVRWDVRPAAWERHACLVAGRELTAREWHDALPKRPQQRVC
jgi:WD40 repeat protein